MSSLLAVCCFAKAQNIIQAEYFFDNNDLGFGSCTPITLIPSVDSTWQFVPQFSVAGLSVGSHKLYIRTKDGNNHWSHTIRRNFYIPKSLGDKHVVDVEYFFTDDLGFSSCYNLPLTPSTDSTWIFNIPYSQIPVFNVDTTIFFRVRDSINNEWSHTVKKRQIFYPSGVGIDETISGNGYSISPNPAADNLTISFSNISEPVQFNLFNALGKVVLQEILKAQSTTVKLNQPPGIYFVKLSSNKKTVTRKIIVQNR